VLRAKWEAAVRQKDHGGYNGRLGHVKFEDVKAVNDALRKYDVLTEFVPCSPGSTCVGLIKLLLTFECSRLDALVHM
jgi:hypothetical protein